MVEAVIVGGGLVPHGDFAYDPTLPPTGKAASERLHESSIAIGRALAELDAEILLLITPHGVTSQRDLGLYSATNASGFARIGDDLYNISHQDYDVPVNVSLDANLTEAVAGLGTTANVTTLAAWGDSEPFPLRWGEGIPLLLLQEGGYDPDAAVVASLPARRYVSSADMVNEMRRLGNDVGALLVADTRRVAVVVSGDLAHTHSADGPYGFSPTAEPFDLAIGTWLRNLTDATSLVVDAAELADDAKSCGYLGLVMLLGIFEYTQATYVPVRPVVGPYHPTYYGMATAFFVSHEEEEK